jgi:hypothetical protein
MIEFYIGNTGIKFQNIEDIKYIIDNSLEEELLNFFMSLVDVQMIGLFGVDEAYEEDEEDDNFGLNLGD